MKRNRSGRIIHRDTCPQARTAAHWGWADSMSEQEMILRLLGYPNLQLCRSCFGGTKEELAARIAAGAR